MYLQVFRGSCDESRQFERGNPRAPTRGRSRAAEAGERVPGRAPQPRARAAVPHAAHGCGLARQGRLTEQTQALTSHLSRPCEYQ
jgi:hypothetical protein